MGMNKNTPFDNEHVVIDVPSSNSQPGQKQDDPFASASTTSIRQNPSSVNNLTPLKQG